MKITAAASYAIAAMAHIVNLPDGQLVRCADVSRDLKLSEPYLLHALTDLAKAGVLISVRGYLGGYKLARPAQKITLLDIVQVALLQQYLHTISNSRHGPGKRTTEYLLTPTSSYSATKTPNKQRSPRSKRTPGRSGHTWPLRQYSKPRLRHAG